MNNFTKLYRFMMKKLMIPAIILGLLSIISSALFLFASITQYTQNKFADGMYYYYSMFGFFRGEPTAASIAPSLIAFMFIGSVVFTYIAFNHLNKRNASDFYHSLPQTRMQSFSSRFLSIITYQVAIIIITLAVSVAVLMINGINFNPSFIVKLFFGYTAGSLLVIGSTLLAMSITGTFISNVLVTGLILFLPRMILFICDQFINSLSGYTVIVGQLGIILNPVYNIVTAVLLDIFRIWEYFGTSETLIHTGSIVYTMVLGILYIVISALLMKSRKSELSGKGSINKISAYAISCAACLPFLILTMYITNGRSLNQLSYTSYMYMLIVGAISFAVFILVGFMLTVNWKSVLKSIPYFAVCVVLAIGFASFSSVVGNKMATRIPDRDDIKYIKINENTEKAYRYSPVYSYNDLLVSEIEFTDDEVLDAVYDCMLSTNEDYLNSKNGVYDTFTHYTQIICEIKLNNGKKQFRQVNVFLKDVEPLYDALIKNKEYINAYSKIAVGGEISTNYYDPSVDDAIMQQTKEVFEKEYESLSLSQKSLVKSIYGQRAIFSYKNQNNMMDPRFLTVVCVLGEHNGTPYMTEYPITEITPKTANFYMNETNKFSMDKLIFDINNVDKFDEDINYDISIELSYGYRNHVYFMYSNDIAESEMMYMPEALTDEELEEISKLITKQNMQDVAIDEPYMVVRFNKYGIYNDQVEYHTCYVSISQEKAEELKEMYNEKVVNMQEMS